MFQGIIAPNCISGNQVTLKWKSGPCNCKYYLCNSWTDIFQ